MNSPLNPSIPPNSNVTPLFGQDRTEPAKIRQLLWQKRLQFFLNAERSLHTAKRLMTVFLTVIVVSLCTMSFSLFVASYPSSLVIVTSGCVFACGAVMLSVCIVMVIEQKGHRDALSRKFYATNHELDITDDHLVLIDRGNSAVVTRVSLVEL